MREKIIKNDLIQCLSRISNDNEMINNMPSITLKEAANKLKDAYPKKEHYGYIMKLIEFTIKGLNKGITKNADY